MMDDHGPAHLFTRPQPAMRRGLGRALALFLLLLTGSVAACGDDESSTEVEPPETPVVSTVSPSQGAPGTEVRIDGSGFGPVTTVFFDDLESPRVQVESGALFALAPAGLTEGTVYDVRVVNANDGGERADTVPALFTAVAPGAIRVNGVTVPRGLVGMTVIIDGSAFGDSLGLSQGAVFFEGVNGSPIEAAIADENSDWADDFIVTSVPTGIADTSSIWVETVLGASDTVEFRILQSGQFSPSNINWSSTTALPEPLQGLGAVFVPVESGASPANYVFVLGGADDTNTAQTNVYRNTVEQTGALAGAWTTVTALPEARAYHVAAAATAFTAALDTTTTVAVLYSLGGVDASGAAVSSVHLARIAPDGSMGSWEATTALPEPLHSAGAALFRGYMYLAGGAGASDTATVAAYRAPINPDGTLGDWEAMPDLPEPQAYGALMSFGPFLYSVGGETDHSAPVTSSQTGTETAQVYFGRINVRTAELSAAGWTPTESMAKKRSKHGTVFAGGALFTTSGIFAGTPGSSENTYAVLNSDGTLQPWQGATGAETINTQLGKSLYNPALVAFIDASGVGHLLVLGGADIANEGTPSADVVWY